MYLENATRRTERADQLEASKPTKRTDVDINTDIEFLGGRR